MRALLPQKRANSTSRQRIFIENGVEYNGVFMSVYKKPTKYVQRYEPSIRKW